MGIMDKLGSAAAVAKWKADQQMRAMRVQNNIHDLENQVKNQKVALADKALELNTQGLLVEEPLRETCAHIDQLDGQIKELTVTLHQIQAEQPPSDNQQVPVAPVQPQAYQPPAPVPVSFAPAYQPPARRSAQRPMLNRKASLPGVNSTRCISGRYSGPLRASI